MIPRVTKFSRFFEIVSGLRFLGFQDGLSTPTFGPVNRGGGPAADRHSLENRWGHRDATMTLVAYGHGLRGLRIGGPAVGP